MCSLQDAFHAENRVNGHQYNCSYGAGADCDCPAGEVRLTIVSAVLSGGALFVLNYAESQGGGRQLMVDFARRCRDAGGWKGLRICERLYHMGCNDEYSQFIERAASDMDRLHDWATDPDITG